MEIEYPVNCPLMESAISMDECIDIHMVVEGRLRRTRRRKRQSEFSTTRRSVEAADITGMIDREIGN